MTQESPRPTASSPSIVSLCFLPAPPRQGACKHLFEMPGVTAHHFTQQRAPFRQVPTNSKLTPCGLRGCSAARARERAVPRREGSSTPQAAGVISAPNPSISPRAGTQLEGGCIWTRTRCTLPLGVIPASFHSDNRVQETQALSAEICTQLTVPPSKLSNSLGHVFVTCIFLANSKHHEPNQGPPLRAKEGNKK